MLRSYCFHSCFPFGLNNPRQLTFKFSTPYLCCDDRPSKLLSNQLKAQRLEAWIAELPQQETQEEGPIELPPSSSSSSLFAETNDPTPLQVATSVLLTGAISIFLFRSLRRRAKRAKEMRFRSGGVEKTTKEEALDALKSLQSASIEPNTPPSPAQALLGGLAAGVIAIILYKFTTTIEAALSRQTISDSFSVRQITITIRTIVNGLCYLATAIFGVNSIGLILYSGQLALSSLTDPSPEELTTSNKGDDKATATNSSNNSIDKSNIQQNSDEIQ